MYNIMQSMYNIKWILDLPVKYFVIKLIHFYAKYFKGLTQKSGAEDKFPKQLYFDSENFD